MNVANTIKWKVGYILTLAFALGCQLRNQPELPSPSSNSTSVERTSNVPKVVNTGDIIQVHYINHPRPFSFQVKGTDFGTNHLDLIKWLKDSSNNKVIFHSEYKMMPEQVDELVRDFRLSGITILEFWMPRSSFPSPIDVLK